MPKHRNLLIVVADGEHVRFVRPAGDNALHSQNVPEHVDAADASVHHAKVAQYAPRALEKEKFAGHVARELNQAAAKGAFEELVLVAPPHSLKAIEGGLDTTTRARLVGSLAKDLVKTPDHELWPHVREWVRPVHRENSAT